VLSFQDLPRALVNHDTCGALKMVAETGTDKILGISAIGDHAAELLLPATYAITAGMTTRHLADTWAPYLTTSEALRLVAGTAQDALPTPCFPGPFAIRGCGAGNAAAGRGRRKVPRGRRRGRARSPPAEEMDPAGGETPAPAPRRRGTRFP